VNGRIAWTRDIHGYDRHPPGMAIDLIEEDSELRESILQALVG